MINIFPGNDETFYNLKGQKFEPNAGEGMVYVKLVGLKPETLLADPKGACENVEGVIALGDLQAIKNQFNTWLDALIEEYQK
jgi:hypothetical protein